MNKDLIGYLDRLFFKICSSDLYDIKCMYMDRFDAALYALMLSGIVSADQFSFLTKAYNAVARIGW